MLNENLSIEVREKQEFKPLPANVYQVELLDITSKESPTYDTKNKPDAEKEYETILNFQFTLLAGRDGEDNLRGRNLWANFIPTYLYIGKNGKNKLFQIIEALLGRNLTPQEEAEGMNGAFLNGLVGKQLRVGTEIVTKNDATYTNIKQYYTIEQEMPAITDEEKEGARVKDKDEEEKPAEQTTPSQQLDQAVQEPTFDEHGNPDDVKIEDVDFNI